MSARAASVVVGVAAALVVAVAVVLQSGELSVPPVRSCEGSSPTGLVHGSVLGVQSQARTSALQSCLSEISSTQSSALQYGWVAVFAVLAVAVGVGVRVGTSPRRRSTPEVGSGSALPHRAEASEEENARAAGAGAAARDRAILATACIDVSDTVDSPALREQLVDALHATGVRQVEVEAGEPFDSSRHRAVGTVATDEPRNHNMVARTQRPGYVDHGKRVRYPEVLVFKWSGDE